jgi:hypothetical protein
MAADLLRDPFIGKYMTFIKRGKRSLELHAREYNTLSEDK